MLRFKDLLKDKRAATAVEYGMILALIVIAMIVALSNVAATTTGMWNSVAGRVSGN